MGTTLIVCSWKGTMKLLETTEITPEDRVKSIREYAQQPKNGNAELVLGGFLLLAVLAIVHFAWKGGELK